MKKKVCVLIVTYNRKNYLLNLLNALFLQTYKINTILIFDNDSSDGTIELLKENKIINNCHKNELSLNHSNDTDIYYYQNDKNTGGSGGFSKGIELAKTLKCDYIWCMDDDVLPEKNCLEILINALKTYRVCIPNRTDENFTDYAIIDLNMSNPFKYNNKYRKKVVNPNDLTDDIIDVADMAFEGPIFENSIVDEVGLPNKDLFIFFDDADYAYRIHQKTKIGFVKKAILHKQIIPTIKKDALMGWREYYGFRNQYWFDKKYGKNIFVKILRPILNHVDLCCRAMLKRKKQNIKVLRAALYDSRHGISGKVVNPGSEFIWEKRKTK